MMPLPKGSSIFTRSRRAITTRAMPTIFFLCHGVADHREGLLAYLVLWAEMVGRVAVTIVDGALGTNFSMCPFNQQPWSCASTYR
jgi:hypothetical protein